MESAPSPARSRILVLLLTAALGAAIVVAAVLLITRDRTPILTQEKLEEARARWREAGPRDYDLRLLKRADRLEPEEFDIEVRDRRVTSLERNGTPLPTQRKSAYSIDGLFDIMQRELEMAAETNPTEGARSRALLRARFDDRRGIPVVFKVFARNGTSFELLVLELATADGTVLVR